MTVFTADTYKAQSLSTDSGNVLVERMTFSSASALAAGDEILLGKLPPFVTPIKLSVKQSNLGSAKTDIKVGDDVAAADITIDDDYLVTNISKSESEERDVKAVLKSASTSANFSIVVDLYYVTTELE